ncbi:NLP/P60 protein [Croceitalea dokdonensis DOKDO 023]|uniref:NLP/P60 protein n=1 Tax=Croceitalea dokdonensis DOKDO 023 TaxID=1300341 RepID=A0A0P7ALA0_9FLAO|nr:C40 family peptidase [Croceitalea dokdonensis]KPM32655.1 NLP/P60 protein [Croceitalea dokdonensis DOKDO 023]
MSKKFSVLLFSLLLVGCFGKKRTTYGTTPTITVAASENPNGNAKEPSKNHPQNLLADAIVESAMKFTGTRYRYGGTTKKGMDCSGLIYVALQENDIIFPRVSTAMANEGKRIGLVKAQKGDLLFFKTRKRGKKINHVGLVVSVDGDDIKFIHASTSRGVIVSSLREGYWNSAFVKATRIL